VLSRYCSVHVQVLGFQHQYDSAFGHSGECGFPLGTCTGPEYAPSMGRIEGIGNLNPQLQHLPQQLQKLGKIAAREDVPVSWLIRKAIDEFLKRKK
jgi:hypothetical protein